MHILKAQLKSLSSQMNGFSHDTGAPASHIGSRLNSEEGRKEVNVLLGADLYTNILWLPSHPN